MTELNKICGVCEKYIITQSTTQHLPSYGKRSCSFGGEAYGSDSCQAIEEFQEGWPKLQVVSKRTYPAI